MHLIEQSFSSSLPTKIVFGVNCVNNSLVEKIKELKFSKVFVSTDPGLVKSGTIDKVIKLLNDNKIDTTVFSEVEANPYAETIMKGSESYKQESCEMIIAIGGGSPMDFAKAVAVVVSNPGHILDYRRGEKTIENETPLIIAIPTTVGTGSEVTHVSVVTDSEKGRKFVIASPLIMPEYAFIDPLMTTTLPRHVVAETGADALVHAIEAYTSVRANPITDGLAIQVVKMISQYLPESYAHPGNLEARSQIHLASTMAGMAFGLAGVGLVHSCSHPMSARYRVAHGLANAVLLPYVMDYNLISNYKKYADLARVFDSSLVLKSDKYAAESFPKILRDLTESIGIPRDFRVLNIEFSDEMINQLAEDALNDVGTIPNNPRKVEKQDIVQIYKKVLQSELK